MTGLLASSARVVLMERVGRPTDPSMLTAVERRRRDRLRSSADRRAYQAAHVLAREAAAALLNTEAADLTLAQDCARCGPDAGHGVPRISAHPDVRLSLSHSAGHVAAIAAWTPCGIDIETLAGLRIVESALTDPERAWVTAQPDARRAFARLWTRKEAIVKASSASLEAVTRMNLITEAGPAGTFADLTIGERHRREVACSWTVQRSRACARS